MALSLLVHVAAGIGATGLALDTGGDDAGRVVAWRGKAAAASMLMEWAPPEVPETPEPETPRPEPIPEPAPAEMAPEPVPPPPPPEPLRLGLEESDQTTRNVMGFNDPTPHAAPEVGVDQPALDPMAGASLPGGPTPAGQPETTDAPEAAELEPETVREFGPPRPPLLPPAIEQTATPAGDAAETQPARPEVVEGRREAVSLASPAEPGPLPGETRPSEPAQPATTAGETVETPGEGEDEVTVEPVEPVEAAEPVRAPASPPPGQPEGTSPPSPAAPAPTPGNAPAIDPVLGSMLGIRSEKEADPGSRENPLEIQLGRPAAGQGLEIITRRPNLMNFSRWSRTLGAKNFPIIDVKFGRDGHVVLAKVVRSSGMSDLDSPLIAAVYTWTARGKRLETISRSDPHAGITVTVTIMIR